MSEPHAEYVDRIINRLPPDLAAVFAEHITPEKMRELLINAVGLAAERHIGELFAEFQRLIVQEVREPVRAARVGLGNLPTNLPPNLFATPGQGCDR